MTIRLVIADDHPVVLVGLAHMLAAEPDLAVLEQAVTGDEALAAVEQCAPDILVLDLRLRVIDGLSVMSELRERGLATRVIVFTALEGPPLVEALRLGARGLLTKRADVATLAQCVRDVHAGREWIEGGVAAQAAGRFLRCEAATRSIEFMLTRREWQVARLVASGLSYKAVARDLDISEGTAKIHIHHVYEKLRVDGRMALRRHIHGRGIE